MRRTAPGPVAPAEDETPLSARELEVLRLITLGNTDKEIAEALSVALDASRASGRDRPPERFN